MQSRNRNRNRVLDMDSLGTGTGTGFQDWTVSEPESESKKLEPGTSAMKREISRHLGPMKYDYPGYLQISWKYRA